jgi:hypothetical protein
MNVITQDYNNTTDFDFVRQVFDALDKIPTKNKVVFPLPNRCSAFADIDCRLFYDDYKPHGEFKFHLRSEGLEMAHSIVISTTVTDGSLKLQMVVKPNGKLRRAGARSLVRIIPNVKLLADAICANYIPGSNGRKIVVVPTEKQFA